MTRHPGMVEEDFVIASFARALAAARAERGWTQRDLAHRLQVAQATIGNLEVGLHAPTLTTMWRLLDVLDMLCVIGPDGVVFIEAGRSG